MVYRCRGPLRPRAGRARLSRAAPAALTAAGCLRDLRGRAFALDAPAGPLRVGLELEWIPLAAEGLAPVPPVAAQGLASLPFLRRHGERLGWREEPSVHGLGRFVLPQGGVVSYEPGGQVELSTPPLGVAALDAYLDGVARPLVEGAARAGIVLLSRGMDPVNPVAAVPLALTGPRYRRQARHYARLGPAGARMMRQSAALHVNVDLAGDADARWRAANRAAPFLLAAFANAPRLEGRVTGRRSERAEQWRRLDPARTGVFTEASGDPVEAYLDFALQAPSFLLGDEDGPPRPFRAWLEEGVEEGAWREHLSTLFPEARPRGYLELRPFDALPSPWWIVPAVVAAGLLYDPTSARAAADLDGGGDLLERAGREGVRDAALQEGALRVMELALEGAARLGEDAFGAGPLERTRVFLERFTAAGRDPGDEGW